MSCVYRGEAAAGLRAFLSHGRRRCGRPTQTSQVRFVCAEQSGLARLCRSATSASAMWRERAAGTLDVLLSQVRSGRSAAIHQTHVLARIRTPTHTHTHTRTRTRKHTQAHTDTLTHAHMHTHPPPPSRRATVREAALHSCWVSSTKLHVRPDVTGLLCLASIVAKPLPVFVLSFHMDDADVADRHRRVKSDLFARNSLAWLVCAGRLHRRRPCGGREQLVP